MTVAVVTAWQDHPELADDYFAALAIGKPDQVVVVDDGSDPPLNFAATRLEIPSGFCTASNAGLALVETEHVVMLNNDVRALRDDWFAEVAAAIEPGVVIGPLRYDPHGNVPGVPHELTYVDGWCLGMTTKDARSLGGWDELYDDAGPAYFSDNALSFRARVAGMRLRDLRPGLHHKGGTTGGADRARFERALAVNGELFAAQVREAVGA